MVGGTISGLSGLGISWATDDGDAQKSGGNEIPHCILPKNFDQFL